MKTDRLDKLFSCLRAVHMREQSFYLAKGAAMLCAWLIALFLVLLPIDWLIHLPSPVRVIVLVSLIALPVYKAWVSSWRYFRSLSLTRSALKLENTYDGMQSLLITGVQFHEHGSGPGNSSHMTELAINRAEQVAVSLSPKRVVPFKPLRTPALIAVCCVVALCVLTAANSELMLTGLTRLFVPWVDKHYPTDTAITLVGGDMVVKEGESIEIRAHITHKENEPPTTAALLLKTGKGRPHKRVLDVRNGECEYGVPSAFRSFQYALEAGDAETKWHAITVITAPRPVKTRIRLSYPEYMQRPPETMDAMTLTVPEGTEIEWEIRLDKPVRSAAFSIDDGTPTPLGISDDGLTVRHSVIAKASGAYVFHWVELEHNFDFKTAKHYLQVAPDQPPQVALTSPRKNLFATLNRPLPLEYRTHDDHGIGNAFIIYGRGNAEPKRMSIDVGKANANGIRTTTWDYRKHIKDIEVGETVSISFEVKDSYPQGGEKHIVQSEFRRITFLSLEDYLAKMQERGRRLLSQLRSIYRQERAAYDVIRNLDPKDNAFEQTCFMESARQDILVERIAGLNSNIKDLLADLDANAIKDKSAFADLITLPETLKAISLTQIAKASSMLLDIGPATHPGEQAIRDTARSVNGAARNLGNLVIKLGVREAMEVFAMELHVIAQSQSALRLKAIEGTRTDDALAAEQHELGMWVDQLLSELMKDPDYSTSPLSVVRLARMVKNLRKAGIAKSMGTIADTLAKGDSKTAIALQKQAISDIFRLECNIRAGSEFEALLNARQLFSSGLTQLNAIRASDTESTSDAVAHELSKIYRGVRLLILPSIPAPEPDLLARKPTDMPAMETLIGALQKSLERAIGELENGSLEGATPHCAAATKTLTTLNDIIHQRLREVTKVSRYAGSAGFAMERLEMVRELYSKQMRLSEKVEDADYEGKSVVPYAPSQLQLSKDVAKRRRRLKRKARRSGSMRSTVAMLRMLDASAAAMVQAAPELKANNIDEGLDLQLAAEHSLKMAMSFAGHESKAWMGLANLAMTAEGVAMPARYMGHVVDEQHDLIAATRASTRESRRNLIKIQKNLGLAVVDVSELLDGAGSALDFEQAILFAGSDMGLSVLKLEADDTNAAMRAQRQAVESVADLHKQFQTYERQFYYFVSAMEYLQQVHGDVASVVDGLKGLQSSIKKADAKAIKTQLAALKKTDVAANVSAKGLYSATGRDVHREPLTPLADAVKALASGDTDTAVDGICESIGCFDASMMELRELMAKVAYVPSIEPIEAPPEYHVMLEMVTLLLDQRDLIRTVYDSDAGKLPSLVPQGQALEDAATDLVAASNGHKRMIAARKAISATGALLGKSDTRRTMETLYESEEQLRQCVLEYALFYVEIKKPRGSRRRKRVKPKPVTSFKMSLFDKPSRDKEYGGVEGEDPEAGRTEWEVLGRRDRAALNENFVRELPLEYREFLRDYYERLADDER